MRTGKSLALTARDLEIFRTLSRYRYLRSTYLHAFTGGTSQTRFKERLGDLFHEGFLDRPSRQWEFADARCRPVVYELSERAERILREQGEQQQDQRTFLKSNAAKQFGHAMLICECLASIELAAQNLSGLRFIGWSEICARRAKSEAASELSQRIALGNTGVIPDGVFGLEYARGAGTAYRFFALEVDRGTMPVARSDPRQTSVMGKLGAYQAIADGQLHRQAWGIPNLLVLVITTSEERKREIIRQASLRHYGSHMLFKTLDERKTQSPIPELLTLAWERVAAPSLSIAESE
jgi:hypothetical protein